MKRDMSGFWDAAHAAVDKFCDDQQPAMLPAVEVVAIDGEVIGVTEHAYDHSCGCSMGSKKVGFCPICGSPCHC